jgi:citrate synthase
MKLIAAGIARATERGVSIEESARQLVEEARQPQAAHPGLGHRVHSVDPRVEVLFDLARDGDREGDGVRMMRALHGAAATQIKTDALNIDGALAALLS